MTQSLPCPQCGGSQVSQESSRRNPNNGDSVGTWYLGCLVQLVVVSGIGAAGAFSVRAAWPHQTFAEAALLTGTLAGLVMLGIGALCLWFRCWPLVIERTCQGCGYKWVADGRNEFPGIPSEGTPNV
jgi:hypothetical protein